MGLLTADMKRVVEEQRLGYVATVCPDGTPNLSPKGTTAVWDDDHLAFANIKSPGTLANLRHDARVEINVVDPFLRKGYRFKGVGTILESGALYETAIAFYRDRGSNVSVFREVVLVRIEWTQPIDSPAYDLGLTEGEVRSRWERHFQSLRAGQPSSSTSE
jgi:predicted pyridoxine 5'-phosphate oxidase superfamily flavin-nucleotide-binding protein